MNYIKKVKGQKRKQADFTDFDATRFSSVRDVTSKKSNEIFLIGTPVVKHEVDGCEKNCFMSKDEAFAIHDDQAKDAKVPVFITAEGKRAADGDDCIWNPQASVARINGELIVANK